MIHSTTKDRIRAWYLANPKGRRFQCAAALGISKPTVDKWLGELRREEEHADRLANMPNLEALVKSLEARIEALNEIIRTKDVTIALLMGGGSAR